MYDVGAKKDPDSLKVREGLRWLTCGDIRCSKNIEAFLGNGVNKKSVPFYRMSE